MLGRIVRHKKGFLFTARRCASTDSQLRAQPWSFAENASAFQKVETRTTVARFNMDMAVKADNAYFPACFALAAEMKKQGVAPNLTTYNILLRSLAHGGYASATMAVLEDMISVGVHPNENSFKHIIDAHRTEASPMLYIVLRKMQELKIPPNPTTYTLLITRFVAEGNLEVAIQCLHAMKEHRILPDVAAIQAIIILAARQGYPRLAVDLAVSFDNESIRKVEDSVWLACLHSSAAELYAEGVSKSWYILVTDLSVSPDEGLCMLVLHTAGRNGLPDLATDALRVLKVLKVPWMEHHLAPLFEAFCRAERFQEAFGTLNIMRQNNIAPTPQTALPIVHIVQQKPEILDDVWAILVQMRQEGKKIDFSAFTALLQASITTQPLSRALADYSGALTVFGIMPNVETFYIFLDGCISAGNTKYGELAFRQLKEAGTFLDHDVFGRMITLHLTQDIYDDAFHYLEEMQSAGHVPAQHLYEALVLKCANARDARYLIALDEMKEVGYTVHPDLLVRCSELHEPVVTVERPATFESREAVRDPKSGLDSSAKRFIETGGLGG